MLKTNNEILGLLKTFEIPVICVCHTNWNDKYKSTSRYTLKVKNMKTETIQAIFGKKCNVSTFGNATYIVLKTADTIEIH
jgi:hypothetical protein